MEEVAAPIARIRIADGVEDPPGGASVFSIGDDGLFTWNAPQSTGDFTVTVTVNDARNLASAPSSFTLSVTNGAPLIDPFTYPAVAKLDSPWQVQIPARDPDGDPLTYTVQSVTPAPTQLPTITATGLLQWNQPGPAQDCAIVVRVDDGRGGFATATDRKSVV